MINIQIFLCLIFICLHSSTFAALTVEGSERPIAMERVLEKYEVKSALLVSNTNSRAEILCAADFRSDQSVTPSFLKNSVASYDEATDKLIRTRPCRGDKLQTFKNIAKTSLINNDTALVPAAIIAGKCVLAAVVGGAVYIGVEEASDLPKPNPFAMTVGGAAGALAGVLMNEPIGMICGAAGGVLTFFGLQIIDALSDNTHLEDEHIGNEVNTVM